VTRHLNQLSAIARFALPRLVQAAVTMIVAVSLVFIAMRTLPGNPLLARFGQHADPAQMEQLRRQYGWDQPLHVQLGEFLWKLVTTGDLGESVARSNQQVSQELRQRIPATIELTLAALAVAVPLGISAGVAAAVFRNRLPDRLCTIGSLVGVSIPVFFLGIWLRSAITWLPVARRLPEFAFIDFEPLTGMYLLDALLRLRLDLFFLAGQHVLLPAAVLSTIPTAIIARITRSSMLEVLSSDFIRTARAKGSSLLRVVLRHALPAAAVPVTNIAGLQIGLLLSGAVLTETVFDWPGMGLYIKTAVVDDRDYAAAQAAAIVIAGVFVGLNLILDLVYLWLDPRIRTAK
jgi:ABC-type dipeptide/oligopeptide/nickel transport system permease component